MMLRNVSRSLVATLALASSSIACAVDAPDDPAAMTEDAIGGVGGGVGQGGARPTPRPWIVARREEKALAPTSSTVTSDLPAAASAHPIMSGKAGLLGEIVGLDASTGEVLFYRYTDSIHYPGEDATPHILASVGPFRLASAFRAPSPSEIYALLARPKTAEVGVRFTHEAVDPVQTRIPNESGTLRFASIVAWAASHGAPDALAFAKSEELFERLVAGPHNPTGTFPTTLRTDVAVTMTSEWRQGSTERRCFQTVRTIKHLELVSALPGPRLDLDFMFHLNPDRNRVARKTIDCSVFDATP